MDTIAYSSSEHSSLINELMEGMELAKQLKAQMGPEYSVQYKDKLLQQIVSSYDKALYILGWSGPSGQPRQLLHVTLPLSPGSTMGSPKSEDRSRWCADCILMVRLEFCRSYYRCTYRNIHDCWATKQVQKSDADPTVFHITYKGKHTCTSERRSKSAPTSPGKQEAKPENHLNIEHQQDAAMDLGFQNAPTTHTHITDCFLPWTEFSYLNGESTCFPPSTISNTDNFYGSFSPSLLSPSTSGSNYFSMSPCTADTFASLQNQEQHLETDICEMLTGFLA